MPRSKVLTAVADALSAVSTMRMWQSMGQDMYNCFLSQQLPPLWGEAICGSVFVRLSDCVILKQCEVVSASSFCLCACGIGLLYFGF